MASSLEAQKELALRELGRRKLARFIRYVFPSFVENWHHKAIIDRLEAVERGDLRKLMIFVPPRHGKSEIASVHFPAWFFGRNPSKSIIASSYSADLAVTFGRKARNLVDSPEYRALFPHVTLAEDTKAAGQWNTNRKGEYTAVGIGGAITGRGADVFIIDDPVKNLEEAESPVVQERNIGWYRSVARTRLSPQGSVVLIQTRWHDADLAGQLLSSEADWEVVSLPAVAERDEEFRKKGDPLWPDRYPLAELEALRKEMGADLFSSLYQQSPVSDVNRVFKKEFFRYRPMDEVERLLTRCFVTIDPAPSRSEKSDYIGVCVNWVDQENFWNLKAYRIKMDPSALINLIFHLYDTYRFELIGIEKGMYKDVIQPFMDQEMRRRNTFFSVTELEHGQRKKEHRIRGLVPRYEAKQIFHIEGECDDLETELVRFPKSPYDDISDAVAYQLQVAEPPLGLRQLQAIDANREHIIVNRKRMHGL